MHAVVDTNTIAYFLLGTPRFAKETSDFWHGVTHAIAPTLWQAELTSVLSVIAGSGAISAIDAIKNLQQANAMGISSVDNCRLWKGALMRSLNYGISAYDALFVELAAKESLPLVTFDKKLIAKFPDIACRPAAMS